MAIKDAMLMEFKHEMANTRKMLERVPFEKEHFKPHDKSSALAMLATHVARIPTWVGRVIGRDEFDMAVPNAFPKYEAITNTAELLALYDANCADAVKAFENVSDEAMMAPWTFKAGPHVIFTLPRAAAIRNMGMNHQYHHRGQLSVYLRLLDVPVPGMYGPSADEK